MADRHKGLANMNRTLVLVRHGESEWNAKNLFTGWKNPDLTPLGVEEARRAGQELRRRDILFSIGFTSALLRARHTIDLIFEELGQSNVPTVRDRALNERHYGDLSGLNKDEARDKWGEEQVRLWRRSYDVAPPGGESLKDTVARVVPFYCQRILPPVLRGERVLVAAHGNSLRALAMVLDQMTPESVTTLEFATGAVVIYTLNADSTVASKDVVECATPSSKPAAPR
jgi:2,3-bisphosphoglycerate-dependent phosphoglycerate mutase